MLPTSSNALLKTFEEPPEHSFIILLSSNPNALLSTILSRCRKVVFSPVQKGLIADYLEKEHSLDSAQAELVAQLSEGSIARAIALTKGREDLLRSRLLELLAHGRVRHYGELSAVVREFENEYDSRKKQIEDELRTGVVEEMKELSALQREAFEKEMEGAVAVKMLAVAEYLFGVLLSWYRDLYLLKGGGESRYLMNSDHEQSLRKTLERSTSLLSIDALQQHIIDAKTSLQRSIRFGNVLENLFLKLNLI
jgi:DNA polymerase-3 subunit delta'